MRGINSSVSVLETTNVYLAFKGKNHLSDISTSSNDAFQQEQY